MATAAPLLNAELPEVSSNSEPKEAKDPDPDHGDCASKPPDHALLEKSGNAVRNLAASEPFVDTANPASNRSSPQSCSLNSAVTTEADINGGVLRPASRKYEDGVEQSDDSSVCSNFYEEEEATSDKILLEKPFKHSNLVDRSEEESQLCEANTEIRDTTDNSLHQKSDKDYGDSNTSQAKDVPSNSETNLKDFGDVYTGEIGRSAGEGRRRGEARFAASEGSPQGGSQLLHEARNSFQADSRNVSFRPTDIVVKMIEFQIRVIMIMFSAGLLTIKYAFKVITNPYQTVLQAKHKVAKAFHFILEEIAWLWPLLRKLASKCSYGVLVGTYITVALSFLLLPALVLDFLLMSRFVEQPIQVKQTLLLDYSLPHPSAVASIFPSEQMSNKDRFAVGDPNEILSRQVIAAASHKFDVTVTLRMPESDHNIQIGMFQVSAELLSPRGQSLAKFYQPCMLRFHSNPVRYIRSMFMAIPTFLGFYDETQTLVLRLVDSYVDVNNPVGSVKISLEPRAGFLVGAGLPEIYSTEVLVQSGLPGVKSIIYKFKLLIFLWIGFALFSIEVAFVLCCCRQIIFPRVLFGKSTDQIVGRSIPTSQPKSLKITAERTADGAN